MDEYGIFNDEGMIEGDFYSKEEAEAAVAARYTADDEVHVARCCPEHSEQERENCEDCAAGEDSEEDSA